MELTAAIKRLLQDAAGKLKGPARRTFMAQTVKELGRGGQRCAERELGWDRTTIRKGRHELDSGVACLDVFCLRGRKKAEARLPNLLNDIRAIVDSQSQIDPTFQTERLFTRLSAAEVRHQWIAQKGYTATEQPTVPTFTTKLNALGYRLKTVLRPSRSTKYPKLTPFSPSWPSCMRPVPKIARCYAAHWMPKPPSKWAYSRATG